MIARDLITLQEIIEERLGEIERERLTLKGKRDDTIIEQVREGFTGYIENQQVIVTKVYNNLVAYHPIDNNSVRSLIGKGKILVRRRDVVFHRLRPDIVTKLIGSSYIPVTFRHKAKIIPTIY